MEEDMQWEAGGQDEGARQAESEDEKPTPAEQEAMIKEWEEGWKQLPRDQVEEVNAQWEACTTYTAMLQLNRDFLRGRLPCTPYHRGAIEPETIPLLEGRFYSYPCKRFLCAGC